jgi:uncharacterized protein YutE (UPF0331/DUF86 family)
LLAVDLYNQSRRDRRLEAFVVHMHMAWLYLLQAGFEHDGIDFWYRNERGWRIRGKDGEFRSWELARCIKEQFPKTNDPVRSNVEFFIGFRNKIEHHYERLLETIVAGKCQSHILNYEATLVELFGQEEGLADQLRFPVFVNSLTEDAVEALKQTHKRLPKRLTRYVEEFDAALDEEVRSDHRYDFRVLLIPQTGPKSEADVAMRFVRLDELPEKQRSDLDVVQTLVREKRVPVQNVGRLKPSAVCREVEKALGIRFTASSDHARAWRYYKVRPAAGAGNPTRTKSQYCVWDEPHGDYVYTDAWVKLLIKELSDPTTCKKIIGHVPITANGG